MECYKCKFYCKGNPICIECAKNNPEIKLSRHGVSTISMDSGLVEGSRFCKTSGCAQRSEWTDKIPADLAADLAIFFRSWLRLPADERDIIAALACREMDGAAHPTLADLSKKFGMTKAGIKYKIARACASIPSFREMFPRMSIQVKNRKN